MVVTVDIARPPEVVREWWLDFPEHYEAPSRAEQPHRIVTLKREGRRRELETWWAGPFGSESRLREEVIEHDDPHRWTFIVHAPAGIRQTDEFTLLPIDGGTRVRIEVTMAAPTLAARLVRPLWGLFGRVTFPRTWRAAGRACEQATPAAGAKPHA